MVLFNPYKPVNIFFKGISPKVYAIVQLVLEFVYYNVTVKYVSHMPRRTTPNNI